jgi:tetratricopeptide (TPR) repeat protein
MTDDIANVYRQLAVRYFDRGNLNKVTKIWEKLLEIKPGDDETLKNLVHAYFLRANDYAKAEQFTYAIRYWEKAWELDSTNADIAHNLALAHENRDELQEAVKYWKAAATGWKRQGSAGEKEILKARMHTVHIHLADIALKADNMGRAIAECHQALRYAPEDVRTIVRLANLHLMQGSGNKAVQLLSRARRLSPEDADILQQLSLAYAMKGDFNHSVECIKEILKIDPGNQLYQEMVGQHYLSRAEDALRMKKHAAALRLLDEGLEICPGDIDLRAFVGAVYLDMKDKHKAEVAFQETIAISSTDPTDAAKPYIAVAYHYLGNEMEDDAEVYFAKLIELDPGNPHVYVDIAREYCAFDLCVQSRKYFEKAKKMNPGDPSVLLHIVEVLMERECAEYGLPYAKELMKIASDDPRSYYLLGLAYHFSDMSDEAMDTLLEGTDVAEQTGDDEMMDKIEGLYSHIEFENSFGRLGRRALEQLRRMFGDMEE